LAVQIIYRDRYATPMRQSYRALSAAEQRKFVLEQYERTYPGVTLASPPTAGDDDQGTVFAVSARLVLPHPLQEEDGLFKLAQRSHIVDGTLGIPDKLVRKFPLWLAAGHYLARYSLEAELPPQTALQREDENTRIENAYFKATTQLTWRGTHLGYYFDYAIMQPAVAPADLQAVERQAQRLGELAETRLNFKAAPVETQALTDASLRMVDIMVKLQAFPELQDELIETGKIPELKWDGATLAKLDFRQVCSALLDGIAVRQWNLALAGPAGALAKLMESKADAQTKERCFGRVLFQQGAMAPASGVFATFKPDDMDPVTLSAAWADFHAHQPERARSNLSRFLRARSADGSLNASDAALALALALRLGDAMPPEVRRLSADLRPGVWPAPLFQFMNGTLGIDALLDAAAQAPAAAGQHAAIEARFFIGQYLLAHDNRPAAEAYLNWLGRYAFLGSTFHVLASVDKYQAAREDADFIAAQRNEGWFYSVNQAHHLKEAAGKRGLALAELDLGQRYLSGRGVRVDVPKAISLFESAGSKGEAAAWNELGILYARGQEVPKDAAKAVSYYRQAAAQGDAYGARNLGYSYCFGINGLPIDFGQAFRFLRDAAELEDSDAQFTLARFYFDGKGTRKNDALARFWAWQAYHHHNLDGMAELGLILLKTATEVARRDAGVLLLTRAAAQGQAFAQLEVGLALLDGINVPRDPETALTWLRSAQRIGSERATAALGRMYIEGLGVERDVERGLGMLAEMEKQAVADAFYYHGKVLRSGQGVPTDKPEAARLLRIAADRGQLDGAQALAVMLHTGEGVPIDLAGAAHYYQIAVNANVPAAMNNLADLYEHGAGVPRDLPHAVELYRQAAARGHAAAMHNLAELYDTGTLPHADAYVPLTYYLLAGQVGSPNTADAIKRIEAAAGAPIVARAQAFASQWKPGAPLPDQT
jgi:TPR repeat protein